MTLKPDLRNKATREYWEHITRLSNIVKTWPKWMRGERPKAKL